MEVSASYTTICENELVSKLVPLYEFQKPQACRFWARGVNDTYQLVCNNKTYSLRVFRHGLRTIDAIEFEVAALNHLHKRGLSVAYPIPRKDGKFISELQAPEGLRYAIITDYAHGSTPDYKNHTNARIYGQAVAQLHNLSDDFVTDYRRPRLEIDYLLDTSMHTVMPFLNRGSDDYEYLDKTVKALREDVGRVRAESLDTGFCHGDCHGHNVHLHNDILTHFDFDCCGLGLRVFDLATFKWDAGSRKDADKPWSAFLTAYRRDREVGETDLNLVDAFVSIRHIWWIALRCGNVQDFGNAGSGHQFVQRQIHNLKRFSQNT